MKRMRSKMDKSLKMGLRADKKFEKTRPRAEKNFKKCNLKSVGPSPHRQTPPLIGEIPVGEGILR